MKGLNQFLSFNWDAFAEGKTFIVTAVNEHVDYNTKEHLGSKVDCVIASDKTSYKFKDGEQFTNRFEKISFKVSKDVNIPIETRVMPINAVATIYGEYRNQLSVKCDDIQAVMLKEK